MSARTYYATKYRCNDCGYSWSVAHRGVEEDEIDDAQPCLICEHGHAEMITCIPHLEEGVEIVVGDDEDDD